MRRGWVSALYRPAWRRRCGPGLRPRTCCLTRTSQCILFKSFSLGRDMISVLRTFCPGWRPKDKEAKCLGVMPHTLNYQPRV